MRKRMKRIVSAAILVFLGAGNALAITVYSVSTASDLVTALLGSGITVSNITFAGTSTSAGMFYEGGTAIGFGEGIILSTGHIGNVIGPNEYNDISVLNYVPGDSDLNALIPGYSTYDATVLEFDFVVDPIPGATKAIVSFQYVFASDEYNEYVGLAYNDVFGFFVNGSNIALVPGIADTPVSINNVNLNANSIYFRNNDDCPNGCPIDTEMDGLTTVLTASVEVVPGETNHIKLAVADAGDRYVDSNVFLKLGSFTVKGINTTFLPAIYKLLLLND